MRGGITRRTIAVEVRRWLMGADCIVFILELLS
jgi:hypothetical protein